MNPLVLRLCGERIQIAEGLFDIRFNLFFRKRFVLFEVRKLRFIIEIAFLNYFSRNEISWNLGVGVIKYKKNGIIQIRAKSVLKEATAFLKQINEIGLFDAVEKKMFAEISRPKNGGKGLEGVKEKEQDYWNPMESFLEKELNIIAN